jgi:hypothetical protein
MRISVDPGMVLLRVAIHLKIFRHCSVSKMAYVTGVLRILLRHSTWTTLFLYPGAARIGRIICNCFVGLAIAVKALNCPRSGWNGEKE